MPIEFVLFNRQEGIYLPALSLLDTLKHSCSRTHELKSSRHELKMLRDASYADTRAQPIMIREGSFFVCLMSQVPPIRLEKFMSWCSVL